jgi:hypothetical protein
MKTMAHRWLLVAREIMTHAIAGTFEQDPLAERMAYLSGEKYVKSN